MGIVVVDLARQIEQAWLEAATELGIVVERGGSLRLRRRSVPYAALIREFGRPAGCVVAALGSEPSGFREASENAGLFPSVLAASYAMFDRGLFVDTLNDWQWCGSGNPPEWYSGEPWSR